MAINHSISGENDLAEIQQTAMEAAAKLQSVEVLERQVVAQERDEIDSHAMAEQDAIRQDDLLSQIESTSGLLKGSNRFNVGSDLVAAKVGLPSLELGRMAIEVIGDRGGIFDSVKNSIKGKPLGYNAGQSSKSGRQNGIKTAHFNDISARADGVQDFTNSGVRGLQATAGSAPSIKQVRDIVVGQRMAHEQTFNAAKVAERQAGARIGQTMKLGGAAPPALVASLSSGPKGYVDPEQARRKMESKNLWSEDGSGTA